MLKCVMLSVMTCNMHLHCSTHTELNAVPKLGVVRAR